MSKIQITCDSTCDLTKDLAARYEIEVIPLGVCLGNKYCKDGVDITSDDIYRYAEESGELPKTSAISIGDYMSVFQKYVSRGFDVIHICLSSTLSSSYQNACIAAESIGHVSIVDSFNLSTGSGALALMAKELADVEYTPKEIVNVLEETKPLIDVSFILQTLDYLHKGGRCSGIAALGANILQIHPEIDVIDGAMHVGKKYRGNLEHSVLSYIQGKLDGKHDIQTDRLFITHSGVPEDLLEKVKALILQLQPIEEIIVTEAGSTISSHCGPNCLGIVLLHKNA